MFSNGVTTNLPPVDSENSIARLTSVLARLRWEGTHGGAEQTKQNVLCFANLESTVREKFNQISGVFTKSIVDHANTLNHGLELFSAWQLRHFHAPFMVMIKAVACSAICRTSFSISVRRGLTTVMDEVLRERRMSLPLTGSRAKYVPDGS